MVSRNIAIFCSVILLLIIGDISFLSLNFTGINLPTLEPTKILLKEELSKSQFNQHFENSNDETIPTKSIKVSVSLNYNENNNIPLVSKEFTRFQLKGKLIDHFEELKNRFDNGGLEEGLILSFNLIECVSAPETEAELDRIIQENNNYITDNQDAMNLSADELIDNNYYYNEIMRRNFNFCLGIPKEEIENRYYYMETAANRGFVPAKAALWLIEDPKLYYQTLKLSQEEQQSLTQERKQQEQQKLVMLHEAASQGSMMAMLLLASHYSRTDTVKALVYTNLQLEFIENNDIFIQTNNKRLHYTNQLTYEQNELVTQQTQTLLSEIIVGGVIYPLPSH